MGLFDKIKGPVFLKESSSAQEQLKQLTALLGENLPAEIRAQVQRDMKLLEAGLYGEEQLAYELRNSHTPMLILHDLYLACGELTAQIDYLLVTRHAVFVIECKNLVGNIEITNNGDFYRTFLRGAKERIYSPITQNQRHLELIKAIRMTTKTSLLAQHRFEQDFPLAYRSLVVLANPKTIVNDRYAKKQIRQQVVHCDQLISHIREVNATVPSISEKEMQALAQFFLDRHQENPTDYTEKYRAAVQEQLAKTAEPTPSAPIPETTAPAPVTQIPLCPICGAVMVKRKASKGPNAGKEFWGCSNFSRTKCRGIINFISEP